MFPSFIIKEPWYFIPTISLIFLNVVAALCLLSFRFLAFLLRNSLLWSRSSYSKWIFILVDYCKAHPPLETTSEDNWETSIETPYGNMLAHLCFKGIMCFTVFTFSQDASQDGGLCSPELWMDLPLLVEQQTLSWCSKMKLIISDISCEGIIK